MYDHSNSLIQFIINTAPIISSSIMPYYKLRLVTQLKQDDAVHNVCVNVGVTWQQSDLSNCLKTDKQAFESVKNRLFKDRYNGNAYWNYLNTAGSTNQIFIPSSVAADLQQECTASDVFTLNQKETLRIQYNSTTNLFAEAQDFFIKHETWTNSEPKVMIALIADRVFYSLAEFKFGKFEITLPLVPSLQGKTFGGEFLIMTKYCANMYTAGLLAPRMDMIGSLTHGNLTESPLLHKSQPVKFTYTECRME